MTSRLARIASHIKMPTKTDIHLYTTGTPNGYKVSVLLEELGLEYQVRRGPFTSFPYPPCYEPANTDKVTPISLMKNTQKVAPPVE